MSRQLQFRRGTKTENDNFTGASGEITYDETSKKLRIHDGSTRGGLVLARDADVVHNSGNETIAGNKTFSSTIIAGNQTGVQLNGIKIVNGEASYKDIVGTDTASCRVGGIRFQHNANDTRAIGLYVGDTSNTNLGGITITAAADGSSVNISRLAYTTNTTSTTSNEIPTVGWVNTANINNLVHKTGNETISGNKYFNGVVYAQASDNCPLVLKDATDVFTSSPSAQENLTLGMVDKNGAWLGGWEAYHYTDGTYVKQIAVRQQNSENYGVFAIGVKPDGNMWVSLNTDSLRSSMADNLEDHGWWAAYDGTVWYRKWKNGWMELGCDAFYRQNNSTFSFPVECPWVMHVSIQCFASNTNGGPRYASITDLRTTYVTFNLSDDSSWNNDGLCKIYVFGRWK